MICMDSPTQSTENVTPAPHTRIKRRITMDDARHIAEIVAKGHNETKAVLLLGKFKPVAWFNWKSKGKRTAQINELFARTEVLRTDRLVGEIEKAATGSSGIRHDWRAAQFLAGVVDPKFSTAPQASQVQVTVSVDESKLRRIADIYARTLTDAATPAALPAPGPRPGAVIDCQALAVPDQEPGDEPSALPAPAQDVIDCQAQDEPAGTTPDDWTDGTD